VRIIAKKRLREFFEKPLYRDSKSALEAWHQEMLKSSYSNPNEIKDKYRNASIIGDNKIIFNICGNKYRLIVKINYYAKIVFIKFIGTHKQYDKINIKDL
jgi:mRNA interferase HigB